MSDREIVQPQELCRKEIFEQNEYVVPIYQRNYAWGKEEIEQLLNDINDVPQREDAPQENDVPQEKSRKYYLGNLIVNQTGTNVYEVIDGQQRLTTLYLLLSFLGDDTVKKHSLRFEARESSNITLQKIYDANAAKDAKKELKREPGDSSEIHAGNDVVKIYFESKNKDFAAAFKEKLNAIRIIRTQVPKGIDLNHYFEIMNTRGEQLEMHEIVKARIISAIKTGDTITQTDEKDKLIAAKIWDACAQMDKYVQMCFSVEERGKLFGEKWDSFSCKSFEDIRAVWDDTEDTDEKTFTLRSKLMNPQKSPEAKTENQEEEPERFESILSFPNFVLQVNEAMGAAETENDTGLDDKKFLESLEDRYSSKEKALNFIFSLLKYRYLFDRCIIKREYIGQYKTEGKWSLQRLEMYRDSSRGTPKPSYKATMKAEEAAANTEELETNDNKQLRLLQSCLRITYTSPKTMHWVARALTAADAGKSGKEMIHLLENYCCEKVKAADFENRTGFAIDRIVFTYLDYILCRDNADEFKDFRFQFRNSIEHFYPQHPIEKDNAVKNLDSLGNLALITVSANSKFSNMLPCQKVLGSENEKIIEQSPKLKRMCKQLKNNNNVWDDNTVKTHRDEMVQLLKDEIDRHTDRHTMQA